MRGIWEIFEVEREALRSSSVHAIDARAKLLSTLFIILAAVAVGRSGAVEFNARVLALGLLMLYLLLLALLAKLEMRLFLLRIALVLPFGGSIVLLKPFLEPGEVLFSFSVLRITREGIAEAAILLGIMLVCVSAAVLLSSTTRAHELVSALRSLRLPGEAALVLGMTVRFLFLYMRSLQHVLQAQRNRGFALRGGAERSHVLRVLGYTAAMIFLRAYKHGEAVYQAMLSRGYSAERLRSGELKRLRRRDLLFASASFAVAVFAALTAFS